MKKIITMSMIFITILVSFAGAQELSKKDKMQWIREHYYAIENDIKKFKQTNYTLNEFDYYLYYSDGRNLKKIELYVHPERTSYYFYNQKLFFVFKENAWNYKALKELNASVPKPLREERIYVYNNEIVEALIRETDHDAFDNIPNHSHTKILNYTWDETASFIQNAYDALDICQNDL